MRIGHGTFRPLRGFRLDGVLSRGLRPWLLTAAPTGAENAQLQNWRWGSERSAPINPRLTLRYAGKPLLDNAHVQDDAIIPMRIVIALRPRIAATHDRETRGMGSGKICPKGIGSPEGGIRRHPIRICLNALVNDTIKYHEIANNISFGVAPDSLIFHSNNFRVSPYVDFK